MTRLPLDSDKVKPDIPSCCPRRTALFYAVGNGFEDTTSLLLGFARVDPESRDLDGKTPFACAVERGRLGIAKLLLETGQVDLNSRSARADQTPLHHAIVCNPDHPNEVIQMLVELEGVDMNAASAGRTPIMYAIERNLVASVKKLMDSGRADPNAADDQGLTALHLAASLCRRDIVQLLLGYDSVDCNAISKEGFTPLGTAAYHGRKATVEIPRALRQGRGRESPVRKYGRDAALVGSCQGPRKCL